MGNVSGAASARPACKDQKVGWAPPTTAALPYDKLGGQCPPYRAEINLVGSAHPTGLRLIWWAVPTLLIRIK
jgi:hypothetical protein